VVRQQQAEVTQEQRTERRGARRRFLQGSQGKGIDGGDQQRRPQPTQQGGQYRPCAQQRFVGRARRTLHQVGFLRLVLEGQRAARVDHQLQEHDVHGEQQDRPAGQRRQQGEQGDRHVDRRHIAHRLAHVAEDPASGTQCLHQRGEAVVQQGQLGCLTRDVGAALAHRRADVRRAQGRGIVHAVAGHRHHRAAALQGAHDLELLARHDARAYAHAFQPCRQRSGVQPRRPPARPGVQWRARSRCGLR
jgi:hypothetical protein